MGLRTDAEVIASSITAPAAFGVLFDRHATTMFRYFVRRVGPDEADSLLGELFRVAFERRVTFDVSRAEARPWLYGIASNLLARHREREARRLQATARLLNTSVASSDGLDEVDDRLDAERLWHDVATPTACGVRSVLRYNCGTETGVVLVPCANGREREEPRGRRRGASRRASGS